MSAGLTTTLLSRFWSRVEKMPNGGCWLWRGTIDKGGYGLFRVGPLGRRAHRIAWELLRGPFPEGLVADHLCRNPPCVNPDHIEPVTNAENLRRGVGTNMVGARTNRCKHGHVLVIVACAGRPEGRRLCPTCRKEFARKRRLRIASLGCCSVCGAPAEAGRSRCRGCNDTHNARYRVKKTSDLSQVSE